ncbi:MAG: hypothetical protein AAFR61_07165 [Bacteroidota bacterium]
MKKLPLFLILLGLMSLWQACATTLDLQPARTLVLEEKYGQAEETLRNLLQDRGKNIDRVHYYLGRIAFLRGDVAQAQVHFDQGLKARTNSVLNQAGTALILFSAGKQEEANQLLEVANNKAREDDLEATMAIAEAYFKGQEKEASLAKMVVYDQRTTYPHDPERLLMMGKYYARQNVLELSIEEARRTYERNPDHARAYQAFAQWKYELIRENPSPEEVADALDHASKALRIDKSLGIAYRTRAYLWLLTEVSDKQAKALADIRKYWELHRKDPYSTYRYATFLWDQGQTDQVLPLLKKLGDSDLHPDIWRDLREKVGE